MKYLKILFPVFVVFSMLSVATGQQITKDAVIANWNFTLKSEVITERFEKFMTDEYIPAFEEHFTGVRITLLKGERGVKKDGYCVLLHFKSIEERDEWWPSEGISSEKVKEAVAKLKVQEDRLNSMIDWDSFTDWIVL